MEIDLCKIDWVAISAIISALAAIGTLLMVSITWFTLKHNKKQLEEMKNQWKEEYRPYLTFTLFQDDDVMYLKVKNIGNRLATNIHFKIVETAFTDRTNINLIGNKNLTDLFTIGSGSLEVQPTDEYIMQISDKGHCTQFKGLNLHCKGTYNDTYPIDVNAKKQKNKFQYN